MSPNPFNDWTDHLHRNGFAVAENILSPAEVTRLLDALAEAVGAGGYAKRNLLQSVPEVAAVARGPLLMQLVQRVLCWHAFPIMGILFDKTPDANWKVAWHQDNMICVREKIETPGFGPWSMKDGVLNVMPPAEVLANILTVRVHLDDCGEENGPLQIIPASHHSGLLSREEIDRWRERHHSVTCTVGSGGVLLMRPLTLHASSAATAPRHRRVVHLEYAADPLPNGLHWAVSAQS